MWARLSVLLTAVKACVVAQHTGCCTGKHCTSAVSAKHFCGDKACACAGHAALNVALKATCQTKYCHCRKDD
jgi:hypothetical protein